jgi:exopolysaccharide biosynthesis polyprenyl glycosylphosphotransferase
VPDGGRLVPFPIEDAVSEAAPRDVAAVAPPRSRTGLRHGSWLDVSFDALVLSAIWLHAGGLFTWLACLALWAMGACLAQLYAGALGPGFFARTAALTRAVLIWALLEAAVAHLVPGLGLERHGLARYAAGSAAALLSLRVAHRLLLEFGLVAPRTRRLLMVGDGERARCVAAAISRNYSWLGLALAGHVSPNGLRAGQDRVERLLEQVRRHAADEILVVAEDCGDELAGAIVAELRWRGVRVSLVPRIDPLGPIRTTAEIVAGLPVLTVTTTALSAAQRLAKRLVDLLVASVLLVVLAPVMLVIALAVRLDSPGPALFAQVRIGEGGRPFRVLKFRTMGQDADGQVHTVVRVVDGQPVHKFPDDPRVTRAGRWLRTTSLDELPQLLNVVRGQMSLVGPRPELPWIVDRYEPWQFARLAVPPGITGWWQLNGRSERPMHLNTDYDLLYIERYSLLLDVRLLVRTLLVPFYRRGAF